jgi:enamine deaminase RidA (YjgF/YER057c/UK114 family)
MMISRHCSNIRRLVAGMIWAALLPGSNLGADDGIRYVEPHDDEGSSAAVVVPDVPLAHTQQFLPLNSQFQLIGRGLPKAQIDTVLSHIEAAVSLGDLKSDAAIVKLNIVAASTEVAVEVRQAVAKRFEGKAKPAVSYVVGKLRTRDAVLGIDAVFAAPGRAPQAGTLTAGDHHGFAYSILDAGPKVYVSGQAEKGKDIAEMTRLTMASLAATLKHLGLGLKDVVQVKSFVGPFADAQVAEDEIIGFFKDQSPVPPLVFVEWTTAPSIEIELIASAANAEKQPAESVEYITPPGMTASPVFSRVARMAAGPTIYISGLYGTSQEDGAAETREIFRQMGSLLDQTGSGFRHLVKATYYVSTNDASTKLNEIRPEFYDPKRPPAASKAPVTGTGREGRTITIDMIAAPKSK